MEEIQITNFNEQIEHTITALKKVTKMSALDEAFSIIRDTDYADLTKEEQRLCTRWETVIVKCDQLLMETLTEMIVILQKDVKYGPIVGGWNTRETPREDPRDYPEEATGED